jgi:hypothetical protein
VFPTSELCAGLLSADNLLLWQMLLSVNRGSSHDGYCSGDVRVERSWKRVIRCCSFLVMVVEVLLSYVVAAVGASKLNIIV